MTTALTNKLLLSAFADEAGDMIAEQISALQDNQIPYIELRGVDGRNITDLSVKEAQTLRKTLDDAGIRVWSVGSPIGKISISDPFDPHLALLQHTLTLCNILGADKMRIFSFYIPDGDENKTENDFASNRDAVFVRMSEMLRVAAEYGVTLCHENEKGIYGDTVNRCLELHRVFPQLSCVFDPANYAQCHENAYENFQKLTPFLSYIHIKDVDQNDQIVPPGTGCCNIPQIVRAYSAIGGVMTLEPHLMEFTGLKGLENGEKSNVTNRYESNRAAFDDAARRLQAIIHEVQNS